MIDKLLYLEDCQITLKCKVKLANLISYLYMHDARVLGSKQIYVIVMFFRIAWLINLEQI